MSDGGNCFNLNSLVVKAEGNYASYTPAVNQFARLLRVLDLPNGEAIAAAAADWIDSDDSPLPGGAEDAAYAGGATPYRTAGTLMADPSELRAVAGVTPEVYDKLRPWICTLPKAERARININTLLPEQAPLLAMLLPDTLGVEGARSLLLKRPPIGYASTGDFWSGPALGGITPDSDAVSQTDITTHWFALRVDVAIGAHRIAGTGADRCDGPSRAARLAAMGRCAMTATLLFLPVGDDQPWRWLRVDDDAIVARGEGVPAADKTMIAVAPADAVTLHWAALPARSVAQALAAARIVVGETVAAPAGDVHVAVGDEAQEERPIAVVAAERMRAWLAALAIEGVDPDAIVPAPMLLPRPNTGFVRADLGGQAVVRGTTSGFADEARLTDLVTGGIAPETLGRAALEEALVSATARHALDLRQGVFARRRRRAIDWRLIRRLVALGALILLATLAIDLVRIAKYSLGADAIEARADALAREGLPRGSATGDAGRLLDERLSRLRGPGEGFSRTAAAVFAALRSIDGSEASALDFEPNGDLRVTVSVSGEAQANALVASLRAAGFAVTASTFAASGGRLSGQLTVSAR